MNWAPDPHDIPAIDIEAAIKVRPDMFRMAMEKCLKKGEFLDRYIEITNDSGLLNNQLLKDVFGKDDRQWSITGQ